MRFEYYNDYLTKDTDSDKVDWRAANGFCFDENGLVCIVWEEEKGFWNLPGGGREGNENPRETFVREVLEETQCEATEVEFFHSVYAKCFDENGVEIKVPENARCFRYICKLKNIQEFIPSKNINGHVTEIDERKFVTLEELPNYINWLKDTENGKMSFERLKNIIKTYE